MCVCAPLVSSFTHRRNNYLLEASLHQVLWEQVPDEIEEGVQAGDVVVLLSLAQALLQFGVAGVDDEHQDDSQDSSDDGGGHVVHHGPGAQATAGFGVQAGQTCSQNKQDLCFRTR